ncbi:MAG TPA: VWA domain-containing protein [Pyrinomonadaceae bacterium]|nr:VWA domain-containing protein [Pyrinomonadaceae bacterium]
MKRGVWGVGLLALALSFASLVGQQGSGAQTPAVSSSSQQQAAAEDELVRITTNLVQVDAVVTDKEGRIVTDLRAEDFEVFEDGRPQTVTNLSFVPLEPAAVEAREAETTAAKDKAAKRDKNAPLVPPVPAARLRPEQVRRTLALVAGNLSFGSTDAVHDTLKKYVDEQVQPNDLVAVISLRAASGALQQFTTDRRQLARAVGKVRWLPSSGYEVDSIEPVRRDDTDTTRDSRAGTFGSTDARAARERIESALGPACLRIAGDVVALTHLVWRMRLLPGRKSVVYFSDGVSIGRGRGNGSASLCVYDALRQLVDAAARASVVIYAIDARGLVNQYHISAQDDVSPDDTGFVQESRAIDFFESQNGLNFMAENTGGRFIHSKNDLTRALRQVLNDQRGYYLIGYRPTEATFKGKKFHKIEVRVRLPGLRVRSRTGFYSLPDSEAVPARSTSGDRQLYAALASPVGGADVRMQLSAFFFNDPRAGSFVRSLLYINAQDISFKDEPNNFKKAVFDVAAVTFDEGGRIADEFNRTHTVRVGPDTFRHVLLHGLTYSADVPVKRAGAYQLRIVVRDAASGRLGASGQFIEVPDVVRGKQFALSGLLLGEAVQQGAPTLQPGATAEAAVAPLLTAAHPALRRFRPGASLAYSYVIYNPRRVSGRPQLTTQARLFREGREVHSTPETPFDAAAQTDTARLAATGTLTLDADAQPGSYVLQLVVNDAPPGQKRHTATQWIEFEVVK